MADSNNYGGYNNNNGGYNNGYNNVGGNGYGSGFNNGNGYGNSNGYNKAGYNNGNRNFNNRSYNNNYGNNNAASGPIISAENNYNMLTTLLASESLKPYAMKTRVQFDENMMTLCRAALAILKQDKAVFEEEYIKAADMKAMSLGTMASRLSMGQAEYAVETEDLIESRLEGGGGRERALPAMQGIHRTYTKLLRNVKYAVEALERAVKTGSWSVLDAEKALRCIAELAEPAARQAAEGLLSASEDPGYSMNSRASAVNESLRENAESILVKLIKEGNKLIQNDLYAVSRRIVLATFRNDVLSEMDGELIENAFTGKSEELGIMDGREFKVDPETGIRYLTPSSLINYSNLITSRQVINDKILTGKNKDGGIRANLTAEHQALLEAALANAAQLRPLQEHTEALQQTEKFLYTLIRRVEGENPPQTEEEAARRAQEYAVFESSFEKSPGNARKWIKNRLSSNFSNWEWIEKFSGPAVNTEAAKYKDGFSLTNLDGYKELHIPYMTMYYLFMEIKSLCLNISMKLGYKEAGAKEKRKLIEFPFDVPFPIEMKDPSKQTTLLFDALNTVLRADSLPTGYINPASIKGQELIERADKLREDAVQQVRKAKEELLDGILSLDRKEVAEKFRKAIKGQRMKPTAYGWFSSDELKNLFVESVDLALSALTGLKDEDPETSISTETVRKLDEAVGAKVNDKAPGRIVRQVIGSDGSPYNVIAPPDVSKLSTAAVFRYITDYPSTSENDSSVKDSDGFVWYDHTDEASWNTYMVQLKEALLKPISSLNIPKSDGKIISKEAGEKAEEAFNRIMEIFDALKSAGGEHLECVKIMDDAFRKAEVLFIKGYLENLEKFKTAYQMADCLGIDGVLKDMDNGSSFLKDLMVTGKMYGEKQMCGIAAISLAIMGHEIEKEKVNKFNRADAEHGKWDIYDNLSPDAKEELSSISIAITGSTVEKMEEDARYYEGKNSEDSIWYTAAIEKERTDYNALTKCTLPYFTEDTLREHLSEQILDKDAAESLAATFAGSKVNEEDIWKAFESYVAEYKAAYNAEMAEVRKDLQEVNVEKSKKDAEMLSFYFAVYDGSDEKKEKIDELLQDLVVQNPLLIDKVNAVREAFENDNGEPFEINSEWQKNLIAMADDMIYMSPMARANSEIASKKHLIENEMEYVEKLQAEAAIRQGELEAKGAVLCESQIEKLKAGSKKTELDYSCLNQAYRDVAHAGLFAPRDRLLDSIMRVMPKDMVASLGPDVRSARTALKAQLRLLDEAIDSDVYTMVGIATKDSFSTTGRTGMPGPFITGRVENFIRVPLGGGTYSIENAEVKALESEGYVQPDEKSLDMRGSDKFNGAMKHNTLTSRNDMGEKSPFHTIYRNEDQDKAMRKIKWWNLIQRYEALYPVQMKDAWKEEFKTSANKSDSKTKENFLAMLQNDSNRRDGYGNAMPPSIAGSFDFYTAFNNTRKIMNEIRSSDASGVKGIDGYLNENSRIGKVLRSQGIREENTLTAAILKQGHDGDDNRG